MKKIALFLLLITVFSCGASKSKRVVTTKKTKTSKVSTKPNASTSTTSNSTTDNVVKNALAYEGVKYKYGGTTSKGMDCSGLIHTAFIQENIKMPRTTSALSKHGDWVDLKEVQKGDLLFFATRKNSRNVNHVGLVTSVRPERIEFVHSSTSKGVMTSLLSERYWYFAFVQARRVL
ncbi:C40 family peptidase [Olleya sp. YS]|uniref:C40 family peptidase n=1 Tax=Olleya sp. YS TaxID=3028318 RepID=UPI0024345154|nr:C40 family peptidase [Olleya sp. YS]WGD33589.1 C40 family peptidase [Olleya sp. YS]